ncbi:PAS domain S-box protein [Microscilla marina]|nr:PAS domain S-box protein [Microscilla marina]
MQNQHQEMQQDQAPVPVKDQLLAENSQMKERLWIDSNLAKFDDILRSNYGQPLETFADVVILHLAKLTQALKGTFFSLNTDNQLIEAVAGYACLPQNKTFKIGEELIGQSVKSKEIIIWDDIQEGSLVLTGTTGSISGSCIAAVPLIFNNEVYGAVELMYLKSIEKKHLELLERLTRNVAAMLNSIQNNLKTQKLLKEAQKLETELIAREEALRQNMEELVATQETLVKKEEALSGRVEAINHTICSIEFNLQGEILDANPLFLDLMEYSIDELVGQHHQLFVDKAYANTQEYQKFWEHLRTGKSHSEEFKRLSKTGKTVWLRATYTPIKDQHGVAYKVIKLAMNVTQEKKLQQDIRNQIDAIERSSAMVEFDLNGNILDANPLFLQLMGYTKEEVIGKHHQLFVEGHYAQSKAYQQFWHRLRNGQFIEGEFSRVNKQGEKKWIKGIYNPILDVNNKPYKIIKYASDVTDKKTLEIQNEAQLEEVKAVEEELRQNMEELIATQEALLQKEAALSARAEAINHTICSIEFDTKGNIITANQMFLDLMGYPLEEIQGQHHQIFVDTQYAQSQEYARFWEELGQGNSHSAEYMRRNKMGKEVWLRATYTPIKNQEGKPYKVIKLAMDVTREKQMRQDITNQMTALQRSSAVIEFDLYGHILDANPLFLNMMGYTNEEIKGKHHSIFLEVGEAQSKEYQEFWHQLRQGKFIEGEFIRIDKKGEKKWIKGNYNPVLGLDGKPYKIVKYTADITDRKTLEIENEFQLEQVRTAEEELRQNMEELVAIQEDLRQKEGALSGQVKAINSTVSSVEFNLEGKILRANQLFLDLMGYTSEEIIDKHHRMFVDKEYAQSHDYALFWQDLRNNISHSAEYKQQANNDKELWLMATYTPVKNSDGKPYKVIMLAMDVTEEKNLRVDLGNQLAAIDRSMAVVEFDLAGQVIDANQQFLQLMGYQKEEVIHKHHGLFVSAQDAQADEYQQFWHQLKNGKAIEGEFMQVNKDGDPIWVKGIYNPILDVDNKPYKIIKFVSDITERKKLELQNTRHLQKIEQSQRVLKENNEELEAMQEVMIHKEKELSSNLAAIDSTISAIEFDMDGKIIKANQLFLNLMGYTQNEIKDQHHQIFTEEAHTQSQEYADFWNILRQGKSHSAEFKHISKHGNEVWLRATYTPVKDAKGELYKVKKLAMDVTEEKMLRQKNSNQLKAIDRSTAVAEFDLTGNILYANEMFLDLMGYTSDELQGKHHRIFIENAYAGTTECENFWPTLQGGQFIEGEFWRINKNGDSIWIKGSYTPVLDLNGKPYKVVKYGYDITYQKKLEDKLKDQILKLNDYKFALDSAAIVAITDVKGKITYVNDKFCKKSKYSREELIGQNHRILNSGYHSKEFIKHLWNTIAKGQVWRSEIKNKAKDGEFYWVDTTIIPFLDNDGKPYMYLAIRFDISNSKKLEEELKNRGYELEQERNRVKVINDELAAQNELVADKNKSITDSIEYALRIQEAILPIMSQIKAELPNSFILFKPRDIVSGDFYWFANVRIHSDTHPETMIQKSIIAAIDCTGHGVPGAFMSMIGNQLMNDIVISKKVTSPDKILNQLNKKVRQVLKQDELDNQDGMDMNLCVIDKTNQLLEFAGAKNAMIYIHNGEVQEVKADRTSIGGFQSPDFKTFSKKTIPLIPEDDQVFYLCSDGFQDQMGGPNERKFMRSSLRKLLVEIHTQPMHDQQQAINQVFNNWLSSIEQLDDVLVIGFRVPLD